MDTVVTDFMMSLPFDKLVPIVLAMVAFGVTLVGKSFVEQVVALRQFNSADFIRVGDKVRMGTATGSIDGTIRSLNRRRVVIDTGATVRQVPTRQFMGGMIETIKA